MLVLVQGRVTNYLGKVSLIGGRSNVQSACCRILAQALEPSGPAAGGQKP